MNEINFNIIKPTKKHIKLLKHIKLETILTDTSSKISQAEKNKIIKYINEYIEKNYGYDLGKPLFLQRPFSKVDMSCQVSVPLAIRCFLESHSWESCMRNVYSVKCDTDTVGCIAGSIAEAYYHGTGQNDLELIRRYLAIPDSSGRCDMTLFNWATMN